MENSNQAVNKIIHNSELSDCPSIHLLKKPQFTFFDSSMHPILDALQINIHCVYRRLENSVLYFK